MSALGNSNAPHASADNPHVMRWGAVLAGAIVALGSLALLYTLGLGVGLSAIDVHADGRLRSVGVFAGAWGMLAPLLALGLGSWVTGRTAGVTCAGWGMLHGLVLWGGVACGLALLAGQMVSGAAGAAASAAQQMVQSGGEALGQGSGALGWLGERGRAWAEEADLEFDDLLRPVNERRAAAKQPAITRDQLHRASHRIFRRALRRGGLDRAQLTEAIVRETAVEREEAESMSKQIEAQLERAKAKLSEEAELAQEKLAEGRKVAEEKLRAAADASAAGLARVAWGLFSALALGLVASLAGSGLASRRRV